MHDHDYDCPIRRVGYSARQQSTPQVPPARPTRGADNVIHYVMGADVADVNDVAGDPFIDPTTALGEPTRFTSEPQLFGGAVTPFQSPFRANEVVSIGEGGRLVLEFDEPVVDDPANPFGIDLLIFGNSFLSFLTGEPVTEGGIVRS